MTTDPRAEPLSLRAVLGGFIGDDRLLTDAVQAVSAWHDALLDAERAARQPASPDVHGEGDGCDCYQRGKRDGAEDAYTGVVR